MGVRNALTLVGAVVGSFYGQPQLGAMIGPAIGGMAEPVILQAAAGGDRSEN